MRLYEKVNPNAKDSRKKDLVVPRYITLMQKCVEHKIQDCFIRNTHFNDLYILLLSLDITNIKTMLKQRAADRYKKQNVEVRDISPAEAVKFLKGGSGNG